MAQLVIGARTYEIADPQKLTWGEWRTVKRLCNVLPAEFPTAIGSSDPDAWRALVLISIWRVEPKMPAEIIDELNFMEAVVEMVSSWDLGEEQPEEAFPLEQPTKIEPESSASGAAATETNGGSSSSDTTTSFDEGSSVVPAATLDNSGSRSSSSTSA